ncbi:hypothetical protein J6R97_05415 [bacterium]|nr:hypothetical protein [bacterium]
MDRIVKRTLIITWLYVASITCGHAFDLDSTVDDEIRKKYNPNQLINDVSVNNKALEKNIKAESKVVKDPNLPDLPKIINNSTSQKQADINVTYKKYNGGNVKIKSGTSFDVTNSTAISDWQRKGTSIKFTVGQNIYRKKYTIPAGTEFRGYIIDSHQPQITCNGGLLVLKIDTMIYKGQKIPVVAYVTRANDKKIFFNKIKGERTYLKTLWKKGDWGRTIFEKMLAVSIGLGADSSTLILTPFPAMYGTVCLGANTILSPICAFFSKGEHISIPAGSNFRIKLLEEVMVD